MKEKMTVRNAEVARKLIIAAVGGNFVEEKGTNFNGRGGNRYYSDAKTGITRIDSYDFGKVVKIGLFRQNPDSDFDDKVNILLQEDGAAEVTTEMCKKIRKVFGIAEPEIDWAAAIARSEAEFRAQEEAAKKAEIEARLQKELTEAKAAERAAKKDLEDATNHFNYLTSELARVNKILADDPTNPHASFGLEMKAELEKDIEEYKARLDKCDADYKTCVENRKNAEKAAGIQEVTDDNGVTFAVDDTESAEVDPEPAQEIEDTEGYKAGTFFGDDMTVHEKVAACEIQIDALKEELGYSGDDEEERKRIKKEIAFFEAEIAAITGRPPKKTRYMAYIKVYPNNVYGEPTKEYGKVFDTIKEALEYVYETDYIEEEGVFCGGTYNAGWYITEYDKYFEEEKYRMTEDELEEFAPEVLVASDADYDVEKQIQFLLRTSITA